MKRIVLCVLLAVSGMANQSKIPGKPSCNAALRGQFWPTAANSDSKLACKLSQCGSLEVCTSGRWRYKWQPLTVNIRQMGKRPMGPTAQCSALMDEATTTTVTK